MIFTSTKIVVNRFSFLKLCYKNITKRTSLNNIASIQGVFSLKQGAHQERGRMNRSCTDFIPC